MNDPSEIGSASIVKKRIASRTFSKAACRLTNRRLIGRASERRGKMIAFGYYGGKFSHLDFLLPLLPITFTHFCEPFGGSAAVLINRTPASVETYNDLDSEVVNFFSCLRDRGDELIRLISLTPFSREELVRACRPEPSLSAIERARRFFVRARQTRTGLAQTSSEGRWAHCVLTSRAGMAGAVSRWLGSVEGLPQIVQRLQRVQIENAPATEVIQRYDSEETLFYCDPPYPHEVRGDTKAYGYEMSDEGHEDLAEVLRSADGAVAVSGYRCPLMDRLYRGWIRVDANPRLCNASKGERTESVWLNYDPEALIHTDKCAPPDKNLYIFGRPARNRVRQHAKIRR
jgi:DNA adenine methylase